MDGLQGFSGCAASLLLEGLNNNIAASQPLKIGLERYFTAWPLKGWKLRLEMAMR
ncbi:MAG: hypothetical protein SFY32_13030 [Bacteroidota bacterium]|nr:hypothetical protein [Bacteroidota bacterium]